MPTTSLKISKFGTVRERKKLLSIPQRGSNFSARKIQKFRETHAAVSFRFPWERKYDYVMNASTVSMGLAVSLVAIANNYELRRSPQFLEVSLKASLPNVS